MADLEKLLLEAAGRTTASGRNRHSSPQSRRRRKGSYSDDGSDSKNDDSDGDRGYSNRKLPGSQVPLKKRLEPTDRDDDRSSQEGDDYDRDRDSDNDSVGSDLYKDEDDREKLSKLTELEREMILETRATKRSDRDLTEKLKKRKGQDRKGSPPKAHTRSMRSKAERAGALDELVKRRRDAARGGSGSRYSPVKRRSITTATMSSPSRSESGSHSDEGDSTGDGGTADSDEEKISSDSKSPTFENIKEITIRRSKLAKWFMEPFFDELIVGCFVRVGIGHSRSGPIYRLSMVRNVDASDPDRQYKFDNKTTYKYLNCVWGNESSAARWQMTMISDSPPLKHEFEHWQKEVERHGGHMPTKQEILEKREAIHKTNTFVYSAATVKQMLQEKKSATWRPLNIAAEKDRLRRALDVAKDKEDDAEVERIKARLQELEATRQVQEKDSKASRLAEMNRRNRVENFKNASGLKPVNTGLKAGEAGYDPFSRRWTRSRNYYVANPAGGETAGDAVAVVAASAAVVPVGSGGGRVVEAGIAATAAALEAAADAGKLVDTSAPVDQGTESNLLHNFDLPISLAVLQKFGGPQGVQSGFMARKQRIEATLGAKVPENDGRRHALTLTVSDYKRRRGLL